MREKYHKWTQKEIKRVQQFLECNNIIKLAEELNIPYNSVKNRIKLLRKQQGNTN